MGLFDFASDVRKKAFGLAEDVGNLAGEAAGYGRSAFGYASDAGSDIVRNTYNHVISNPQDLLYFDPTYTATSLLNKATGGAIGDAAGRGYNEALHYTARGAQGAYNGLGYTREYVGKPILGVLGGGLTAGRRQVGQDENGKPLFGRFPDLTDTPRSIGKFGRDLFTQNPVTTYNEARNAGTEFDTGFRSKMGEGAYSALNITTDPLSYVGVGTAGKAANALEKAGPIGRAASVAFKGKYNPIGGLIEGFPGMSAKATAGIIAGSAIGTEIASRTGNTIDDQLLPLATGLLGGHLGSRGDIPKANVIYDTHGEVFKPAIRDFIENPQFPNRLTPDQLAKVVAGKYKADELEWTGINDLINSGKPVLTKAEILHQIDTNGIDIVENLKEYKPAILDNSDISKWKSTEDELGNWEYASPEYASPDGRWNIENPTFVGDKFKLTDGYSGDVKEFAHLDEAMKYIKAQDPPAASYEFQDSSGEEATNYFEAWKAEIPNAVPKSYRELLLKINNPPDSPMETYVRGHYEPDTLAHIRTQDYTTPEGGAGLFIHEIQSDWHQQLRQEGAKGDPIDVAAIAQQLQIKEAQLRQIEQNPRANTLNLNPDVIRGEIFKLDQMKAISTGEANDFRNPNAPFSKNWEELSIKRLLRYAAENGYEEIKLTRPSESPSKVGMPARAAEGFYGTKLPTIINGLAKKLDLVVTKNSESNVKLPLNWKTENYPNGVIGYISPDGEYKIIPEVGGTWAVATLDRSGQAYYKEIGSRLTMSDALIKAGIDGTPSTNLTIRFPEGVADKILGKPLPLWQESRVDNSIQNKIQSLRGLLMDKDPEVARAAEQEINRLTEQLSIKNADTEYQSKIPRAAKLDELPTKLFEEQADSLAVLEFEMKEMADGHGQSKLDEIRKWPDSEENRQLVRRLEDALEFSKDPEKKKQIENTYEETNFEAIRRGWTRYVKARIYPDNPNMSEILFTTPYGIKRFNGTQGDVDNLVKDGFELEVEANGDLYLTPGPNFVHSETIAIKSLEKMFTDKPELLPKFNDYVSKVNQRREAEGNKNFFGDEPLPQAVRNVAPRDRTNAVRQMALRMERAVVQNRGKQELLKQLEERVGKNPAEAQMADIAKFLIKRMPDELVHGLALSPIAPVRINSIMEYDPLSSVIRISDSLLKTETGAVRPEALGPMYARIYAHEVSHHLERFVPPKEMDQLRAVYEDELGNAHTNGELDKIKTAFNAYQEDVANKADGTGQPLSPDQYELAHKSYRYESDGDRGFHEWFAEVMADKTYADYLDNAYKTAHPVLGRIKGYVNALADTIKDFFVQRGHEDDVVNRVYSSFFNGKARDYVIKTQWGTIDPLMQQIKRLEAKDQFAIKQNSKKRDRDYAKGKIIPDEDNLPPIPDNSTVGNPVPISEIEKHVKTYDNAILRALIGHTRINPSILRNDPVGRLIVAYKRGSIANDALARVVTNNALDTFVGKTGLKTLFYGPGAVLPIDDAGMIKGVNAAWGDVFANVDTYRSKLSPKQIGLVNSFNQVINDVNAVRLGNGLPAMKLKDKDGNLYVPRSVKQVGDIKIPTRTDHEKQRLFALMEEGIKKGVSYDDPRNTLELYVKEAYRDIADKQFADALLEHSAKASDIVSPKLKQVLDTRKENLENSKAALLEAHTNWKADPTAANKDLYNKARGSVWGNHKAFRAAQTSVEKELQRTKGGAVILGDGRMFGQEGERIPLGTWSNGALGEQRFFTFDDYKQLVADMGMFGHGAQIEKDNFLTKTFNTFGNATRMASSGFDFAVHFVHLLPLMFYNPKAWGKAAGSNFATFLLPGLRESYLRNNFDAIKEMTSYGLSPGDSEMFDLIEHGGGVAKPINVLIQGAGKVGIPTKPLYGAMNQLTKHTIGRFQNATNTALLVGRAEMWKSLSPSWPDKFELASFISNMTGGLDTRNLMASKNQRNVESMWLGFSPKLMRSTAALAQAAITENFRTQKGRQSMRAMVSMMAGGVAIYTAVGMAMHHEEFQKDPEGTFKKYILPGLDPTAGKKFLSYQINGDWYGIGGQVRAMTQLIGGIYTNRDNPSAFLSSDQFENPILNWYRGRGAPGLNMVGSLVEGTTGLDAMPYDNIHGLGGAIQNSAYSMIPFSVQAYLEGQSMPAVTAGNLGVRTSAATPFEKLDIQAQQIYGKPYDSLNREQRLDLQNKYGVKFTPSNDNLSKYFDEIDKKNNQFANDVSLMTAKLNSGMITKEEFKNWYTDATTEKAGAMNQIKTRYASVSAQRPNFSGSVIDYLGSKDSAPEDQAVNNWYQLPSQAIQPNGQIDMEKLDDLRTNFLKSLPKSTRDYVVRNTKQEFQNKSVEELDTARQYARQYFGTRSQIFNELAPQSQVLKQFGTADNFDKWVTENAKSVGLTDATFMALLEDKSPEIKAFNKIVTEYRRLIRLANPEMDQALAEYYGIEPANRIEYILSNYGLTGGSDLSQAIASNKDLNSSKGARNFALSFAAQSPNRPAVRRTYHRPTFSLQ